ncbi:ABC transporter substrate-binding protein [Actinomadura macra]|uniref:ABC transporter substrate-binding protein n=1 Tax=Actinomadura macra TaxID=46164 RepID=UPI000833698F|nr:ABC transporter substrate-binding protein [Actinomadura macra]
MAEVAPLRTGDPAHLGPYQLIGLLGEGGQGAVYLAEDEPGHRVAVKLLHARFSGDAKARSRFAAEVAVAKRVSPFCTARVLDSDVEGDRPYIVSEYIDGPALSDVLAAEGPRVGADLDRIAIGTMTALAAIHQAGVVHRDFKPGNVLLAPDGPRVIDFGIARALDATGTMSSTAIGTPAYMAPEQISGAPVGPAADVWAWAATMVYASTARPAFGQDSIPAVMHRILNMPPDLGALTEPLRELVAACLAKDPLLRPQSQHVLAHLLRLAGSLPQAGAPQLAGVGAEHDTTMLNQGAEAAAESAGLHASPPPEHMAPPQMAPPPQRAPLYSPGLPMHGPPPSPPPSAATWPVGGSTAPVVDLSKPHGTGTGGRRRGIGVLAGAGGAALVALVLAGAVIAVRLSDDGKPSPTPAGRVGGTLAIAAQSDLNTSGQLDPSHSLSGTGRFVVKQLFTGLTETGTDGVVRGRLASSLQPDATCTTWTISVKPGTTFSDGTPVDAQAFARGWARAAAVTSGDAPTLMADIKGYSDVAGGKATQLSGVTTSGGGVLTVTLTSPNCDFGARLADPVFAPVPEAAGKADNDTYNMNPVGNGPFKVQSYVKDKSVTLVRNDRWAFGKTRLDRVEIRLGVVDAQARAAFTSGEVGWAGLPSDDRATSGDPNVTTRLLASERMLVPLTGRGPMASKEGRLAVSYALDRKKISQAAGLANQPARGLVPAALPGFGGPGTCPSCDAPDITRAKTLATQAGLGSGTTVVLHTQDLPVYQQLADVIAQQLESALGWKIERKKTPLAEFQEYRKSLIADDASGLALFAWAPDYPTPYTMLWNLLGSTSIATESNTYYNLAKYKSTRFDGVMYKAVRTISSQERTELYKQAEKIALDDMALIPLLNLGRRALRSAKYVGLDFDYDGDPTLATAALK